MLLLNNDHVARALDEDTTLSALRAAYRAFARGEAAYAPRIDLYAPAQAPADAYRCGSMSGIAPGAGVAAFRIKSDVVTWSSGVEDKYCRRPGLYSGIILLYAVADGAPLAILQDGVLQHMRVGAALALGVEALSDPAADRLGIIGSGGMAHTCLRFIRRVRDIHAVSVYSRQPANREAFAERVAVELGVEVTVCTSAAEAVEAAPIVLSATNSLEPTVSCDWLAAGAHVSFVSRREMPADLHDRVATVYRLGEWSLPTGADVPGAEWYRGAFAGFAAGPPAFRDGLPRYRERHHERERNLAADFDTVSRRHRGQTTALVAVGTQGLQFAAVGGAVLARARELGLGIPLDDEWFLQTVKD